MYLEYINSESYLEEQVAIKNFVSKMNYVGDFTDIGTESEIHLWIANNLSSTAFLNVTEADVEDRVSIELKINLNEKELETEDNYSVTAHGQLKNSFAFTPKQ